MMRYMLVLAACLSLAAAESSNNKLLLQRLERILQEERAVQERAVQERAVQERAVQERAVQESAVQGKTLHKDGPERRVALTAAITAAAAGALGKALETAASKVDVNKALDSLIGVFSSLSKPGKTALIVNGDSKTHSFYAYNEMDRFYLISASKASAGEGGTAPVIKNINIGSNKMQVYVDNEEPQYMVELGKTYVYTPAKGINPIDLKPDPKPTK